MVILGRHETVGKHYLKVGQYTPATNGAEAITEREFYRQSYIFKDEEAYSTSLEHQNLLEMMDGQETLARNLFDRLDWQHPETWLEEDYANGEYDDCPKCSRMFACYGKTECSHCHAPYEADEGR